MGGHRAQCFLQLVVEHTLAGWLDCLRERMLGAEMFGRPIDYDTGNDAVVRVKASEVRRRLAQYYQSLATPPTVQIDLMAGSFTPQFHWAPGRGAVHSWGTCELPNRLRQRSNTTRLLLLLPGCRNTIRSKPSFASHATYGLTI
jgi:hypothetical protein